MLSGAFNDVDRVSVNYASKYMCTRTCPCSTNLNLTYWQESKLNQFNRTKSIVPAPGLVNSDFY